MQFLVMELIFLSTDTIIVNTTRNLKINLELLQSPHPLDVAHIDLYVPHPIDDIIGETKLIFRFLTVSRCFPYFYFNGSVMSL